MKESLSKIKEKLWGGSDEDFQDESSETSLGDEYIEINASDYKDSKAKIVVKPFIINEFEDIKTSLDALREGYTIALLNIKPLKEKDIVELKRAINKLKKTCDAIEGDIAGFGEDWIVATPSFAQVHRSPGVQGDINPINDEKIQ